jgi:hypothetical protein
MMYKYPCSQHQRYELDDLYLPKSWLDHLGCVVTTDPRVSLHRRDTYRLAERHCHTPPGPQLQTTQVRKLQCKQLH